MSFVERFTKYTGPLSFVKRVVAGLENPIRTVTMFEIKKSNPRLSSLAGVLSVLSVLPLEQHNCLRAQLSTL
jgi:hypothetical protein